MKKRIKRLIKHGQQLAKDQVQQIHKPVQSSEDVRITNETVAARREEVLRGARKYIYPLQASKHRIVKFSVGILVLAVISFFTFCMLELYKFQSTSAFMYGVTQVLPFPVAVINNRYFVSYNDYLFELRHYMHYYQSQQHVDFTTKDGKKDLAQFKQQSLDQVVQTAYVQRLAVQNHVSVSDHDIDAAVGLVRTQNRLGASDQVFQSVLSEFWGWSVDDFRRELKNELLAQKVVDKLDTNTHDRADQAFDQLQHGTDFATLAREVSDDPNTRPNGGDYGLLIDRSNSELPPQVIDALFQLQAGQYSTIINTGTGLEIVKVIEVQGSQVRAAHIMFNFQPITTYTKSLEAKEKSRTFIHV